LELYLLEYYKEIDYKDFTVENYNLIGVYFSEDDAQKAKEKIAFTMKVDEEYFFVSGTNMDERPWEGGFVSV